MSEIDIHSTVQDHEEPDRLDQQEETDYSNAVPKDFLAQYSKAMKKEAYKVQKHLQKFADDMAKEMNNKDPKDNREDKNQDHYPHLRSEKQDISNDSRSRSSSCDSDVQYKMCYDRHKYKHGRNHHHGFKNQTSFCSGNRKCYLENCKFICRERFPPHVGPFPHDCRQYRASFPQCGGSRFYAGSPCFGHSNGFPLYDGPAQHGCPPQYDIRTHNDSFSHRRNFQHYGCFPYHIEPQQYGNFPHFEGLPYYRELPHQKLYENEQYFRPFGLRNRPKQQHKHSRSSRANSRCRLSSVRPCFLYDVGKFDCKSKCHHCGSNRPCNQFDSRDLYCCGKLNEHRKRHTSRSRSRPNSRQQQCHSKECQNAQKSNQRHDYRRRRGSLSRSRSNSRQHRRHAEGCQDEQSNQRHSDECQNEQICNRHHVYHKRQASRSRSRSNSRQHQRDPKGCKSELKPNQYHDSHRRSRSRSNSRQHRRQLKGCKSYQIFNKHQFPNKEKYFKHHGSRYSNFSTSSSCSGTDDHCKDHRCRLVAPNPWRRHCHTEILSMMFPRRFPDFTPVFQQRGVYF